MIIEVETKDNNGNIAFHGKLNSEEASYVLNIGINYLLARGAMPMFTGVEGGTVVHAPSATRQ